MSLPQGLHGHGNMEISENVKHDFQAYKKMGIETSISEKLSINHKCLEKSW